MKSTNLFALSLVAALLFSTAAAQAVMIDWVTVGNPGNAPDTRYNATGFGAVPEVYDISKFEITAGQYTVFLNAVAKNDPNGLYNTSMNVVNNAQGANIIRTNSAPNYSYSVAADWANRPVNFVSFWDAARFVNWLHNDQPTGAQGPGTTEAGAYINIDNEATFARQPGAKFWIPTGNEWHKAAYHNKSAGLAASYFDYPTGTNVQPTRDITETVNPGNNANYFRNATLLIGAPYYRTPVGEFELSDSPYGTFDQGGNVWEWNETVVGAGRGIRGGSYNAVLEEVVLKASYFTNSIAPVGELFQLGFRVAAVPEPATIVLFGLAGIGLVAVRARSRRHSESRQF